MKISRRENENNRQQMDQRSARSKRRQIVAFLLRSKEKSSKWKPPLKNNHYHVNKSGGVLIHLQYKRKKVENMTDRGKELMKETVENLKKLDKESMMLVKASIDILIARQKMDEKNPTNAA